MDINRKFLLSSCLQKSIRRGLTEQAYQCATELMDLDPRTLWRRMGVIALEDIGIAHPFTVLLLFAAEDPLCMVKPFCAVPKSRDACDLCWWAARDTKLAQFKFELGLTDKTKLLEQDMLLPQKLLALQALPFTDAVALLAERGLPKTQQNVLHHAHRRKLEDLELAYGLLLTESKGLKPEIVTHQLPPAPTLDGFPAWTYDMHTRMGREAIRQWKATIPELAKYKISQIHSLLFTAETGRLAKQAIFPFSKEIERQAIVVDWPGGTNVDALLDIATANLPKLHKIRKELADANRR